MRHRKDVVDNLQMYDLKIFSCKDKRPDTGHSWKNIDEFVPDGTPFGVALGGIKTFSL